MMIDFENETNWLKFKYKRIAIKIDIFSLSLFGELAHCLSVMDILKTIFTTF